MGKKSKLQEIRDTTVVAIKSLLTAHTYDNFDVTDCGSTPVIWPSSDDQDFDTYTLDRVYMEGKQVHVDSSSSDNSRTDRIEELPTDTIVEILDFLETNEGFIWEEDEGADEEFVMDIYHNEDVCMGDLLGEMKVSELPHGDSITLEQAFNLYMKCKHQADGCSFFCEDVTCGENGEKKNLLTGHVEPLDSKPICLERREPEKPHEFFFTVNDSGKKVVFSPGNLFWDGSKFGFEKHQYDFPLHREPEHIGHFFWSKDAAKAVAMCYDGQGCKKTDKFFAADGGVFEGFTVLSKEEWMYLFEHALAKNSFSRNSIIINGKSCLVLKPDGFTGTVKDSYTAEEWTKAEKIGLVALPFAGISTGVVCHSVGSYGDFWSATPYDSSNAWSANFYSGSANLDSSSRDYGCSVRLVKVI